MANKGIAAFEEFTAGVLAKITDPDQRRKAEETIAAIKTLPTVAQAFGDGVAGQSEIDRQLQTLNTQKEELDARKAELDERDQKLTTWHSGLTEWYEEKKVLLEKGAAAAKAGGAPSDPTNKGKETPVTGVTEDQLKTILAEHDAGVLGFARDQNVLMREHYSRFGEILDLDPLLRHPEINKVGLLGVYEIVHKERLDKWKTDTTEAERKKIADDAVRKYQESQAQMPYPSPTGSGSGSPLDALTAKSEPVVDAAVAHYQRIVSERNAGGAAR